LALLSAHLVVALVALVGIGGATRVMEAGLACPDWPLCYGSLLPRRQMNVQVFLEWFHRLDAFLVGVAVLVLFGASLLQRRGLPVWLPWLGGATLVLVAGQGALGALTVTQLLPSGIVSAHLITALTLVALASGIHQGLVASGDLGAASTAEAIEASAALHAPAEQAPAWWSWVSGSALIAVLGQCLLGGLMATQWAAGRCFGSGEACGWLLAHRLGANPAALLVLALPLLALVPGWPRRQLPLALFAGGLVALQVGLGIASLRLTLAVPAVTVAHQLTAALLVAVLAALTARGLRRPSPFVFNPLELA
jgi:cytochrome c oxidase assembly protein subunit 15